MRLSVHYIPENKTWSQGELNGITEFSDCFIFDSTRKQLIYGVEPEMVSELAEAIEKNNSFDLTLSFDIGVGGYIWGVVKYEFAETGYGQDTVIEDRRDTVFAGGVGLL